MDDGAVHTWTVLWQPDYLAIQKDGVTTQLIAKSWVVPSVWAKIVFGVRAFNDPTMDSNDSDLYIHKISYDSDISKLPKLV